MPLNDVHEEFRANKWVLLVSPVSACEIIYVLIVRSYTKTINRFELLAEIQPDLYVACIEILCIRLEVPVRNI
jgi:hypothetical protein